MYEMLITVVASIISVVLVSLVYITIYYSKDKAKDTKKLFKISVLLLIVIILLFYPEQNKELIHNLIKALGSM